MSERTIQSDMWDDDENTSAEPTPHQPLTREEAQALMARERGVSPWTVLCAQAAAGLVVAAVAELLTGRGAVFWSALYGAAVVVLPGALLAHGITGRRGGAAPSVNAIRFLGWEFAKIGLAVAMLVLANWIVVPLSWPAMLVALVVCMKMYWLALLWRRRQHC
jgi:ATP synthase protein I